MRGDVRLNRQLFRRSSSLVSGRGIAFSAAENSAKKPFARRAEYCAESRQFARYSSVEFPGEKEPFDLSFDRPVGGNGERDDLLSV